MKRITELERQWGLQVTRSILYLAKLKKFCTIYMYYVLHLT